MMPVELPRVGAFAAGAILVLVALLIGRGAAQPAPTPTRRALRLGVAVAGIALMAWGALPYLARQQIAGTATSTTASTTTAPATTTTTPTSTNPSSTTPTDTSSGVATPAAESSPIDAVGLASSQLAACPHATAPAVPDGATASAKQMTAARNAFQSYDAATNDYVKCVDSAIDRLTGELRAKTSSDQLHQLEEFGASAHNTAIDQEQAVADRLNQQIRAFKARHPSGAAPLSR